jgi:hypothetical protein
MIMGRRLAISLPVAAWALLGAAVAYAGVSVPEFDVRPSCRESTVPDCLGQEQIAHKMLMEKWAQFAEQDKTRCAEEAKYAGAPSYVEWLTCLQINEHARNTK